MTPVQPQPWRCLHGHENTPDQRRCEVCRLPRWLNGYTLSAAAVALLCGLVYGVYSLSVFFRHWEYQSLVKQLWADKTITAAERKQLADLQTYLGLADDQVRRLEAEITGQEPTPKADEKNPQSFPPPASMAAALQRIQTDLEQGRLREARQAVSELAAQQPEQAAVARLKAAIEQDVRGRIEVRVPGEAGGHHILDAQAALLVLQGTEPGFRFYVEPHKATVYLFYSTLRICSVSRPARRRSYFYPARERCSVSI